MNQDTKVKQLHDFLQIADNTSPQIFLAHIAMLAVQDAHRQIQPIHAQKLSLAQSSLDKTLNQYQQLKEQYQNVVQENERLKSNDTTLMQKRGNKSPAPQQSSHHTQALPKHLDKPTESRGWVSLVEQANQLVLRQERRERRKKSQMIAHTVFQQISSIARI